MDTDISVITKSPPPPPKKKKEKKCRLFKNVNDQTCINDCLVLAGQTKLSTIFFMLIRIFIPVNLFVDVSPCSLVKYLFVWDRGGVCAVVVMVVLRGWVK